MFPFWPPKDHSCSASCANRYTCVIKLVNQLPIQHNPQIQPLIRQCRQAGSRLGQTREQLAATFNSLRLPGLASTASNRHVSAKILHVAGQDGQVAHRELGKRRKTARKLLLQEVSLDSVFKSLAIISQSLRG